MRVAITGSGVVSPAGWGTEEFFAAVDTGVSLEPDVRERPGGGQPILVRPVPKPAVKLPFVRNPRMRRTSPVGRFVAGAALEALGEERADRVKAGELRLGVVTTFFCGCVNYSRRFYSEVLDDPATASPIVFPETVFNAPSSHLSAMLGSHAINYTLIGDTSGFLSGLELAAGWLQDGEVDGCLVVCGEEFDWTTAEAMAMFERGCVMGEGAAALYLEMSESPAVELAQIAGPELITAQLGREAAARRVSSDVKKVWPDWSGDGVEVRDLFGEGLGAAAGWQCVAAVEQVRRGGGRSVANVVGLNQHCAAAVFDAPPTAG